MSSTQITAAPAAELRTEEEIIDAMREFAMVSYESVGPTNTYNTIKFITKIVTESPDTYRKIFHPATMAKLQQITESKATSGKLSTMEMLGLVGDIATIFS